VLLFVAVVLEKALEEDKLNQIRTARYDYLTRHLISWLPAAVESAARSPFPWVQGFLRLVLELVRVGAEPLTPASDP
jgi:hypothetical protein